MGGALGMAGTFAPSDSLRGLAWGLDGVALVMAGSLLTVLFLRKGPALVAAGFMTFVAGQTLVTAGAAMDLAESVPLFGAGIGLWAVGLTMVSAPRRFPSIVRILGLVSALLFGITALRIFAGAEILPTSAPLPFFAYPVLVATFAGWIWILLTDS